MHKHIITITGFPGSGKSSTAQGVARALGYEYFSAGGLFRKMAAERGLSVEEINFAAEKQEEIDREVDRLLVELGKEKSGLVVDSRISIRKRQRNALSPTSKKKGERARRDHPSGRSMRTRSSGRRAR